MILDNLLEKETILERVDAYSIYSFYIETELEVGRAYISPLRTDDNIPSFALFFWKGTLMFKDHALGLSGDVFKFIQELYNLDSLLITLSRVNSDFELELLGGVKVPKGKDKAKRVNRMKMKDKLQGIRVSSRVVNTEDYIAFWNMYGIKLPTLIDYNVTELDVVVYKFKKRSTIIYTKELTIGYRIYDKFKIYTPNKEAGIKFLNNYPANFIEGYLQLKYENLFVIVTKALKEIMFFRQHFNWDSVAGKSETTMIRSYFLLKLKKKYEYVFIWLDNDLAGIKAQKEYIKKYPFLIPIYYDVEYKDPTDQYKYSEDKVQVLTEIKQLVYGRM